MVSASFEEGSINHSPFCSESVMTEKVAIYTPERTLTRNQIHRYPDLDTHPQL